MTNLVRMTRNGMMLGGLALLSLFSSCTKEATGKPEKTSAKMDTTAINAGLDHSIVPALPATADTTTRDTTTMDTVSGGDRKKITYPYFPPTVQ